MAAKSFGSSHRLRELLRERLRRAIATPKFSYGRQYAQLLISARGRYRRDANARVEMSCYHRDCRGAAL